MGFVNDVYGGESGGKRSKKKLGSCCCCLLFCYRYSPSSCYFPARRKSDIIYVQLLFFLTISPRPSGSLEGEGLSGVVKVT